MKLVIIGKPEEINQQVIMLLIMDGYSLRLCLLMSTLTLLFIRVFPIDLFLIIVLLWMMVLL